MSPVRQHSSLFTSNAAPPRSGEHYCASYLNVVPDSIPASPYETDVQRTIQELDVYKTPLVPSRLRKAASGSTQNLTSSGYGGPTDMFRSKKGLILMNDERKSPHLGKKSRKGKDKERNGTKPYAGEGGMKRLLARRKKETQDDTNADNVRESVSSVSEEPIETKPMPPPEVPLLPPSGKEVFAPISSAAMKQAGSSLRVGRTLTSRTHISRPQPSKLKFSASFDDDDDAMDENERENEIRAIDEASKRVPTFSVPNGFSFAKDVSHISMLTTPDLDANVFQVAPISHDSSNAKEPPVTSLPFSLSSGHSSTTSSARSTPLVFGASSSKINTPSDSLPPLSSIPPSALRSDPAPVTEKGIPDFFSKSRYVTDAPKEDRSSSIYTDAAPPPISAVFNAVPPGFSEELKQVNNDNLTEDTGKKPDTAFSFERKTKDIVANPFQTLAPPSSSLFNFGAATPSKTESNGAQLDSADVKPEVVSLFGVPPASVDKPAVPSLSSDKPVEEAPSSVFTFGKAPSSSSSEAPPIQTSSLFGTKPADPAPSLFSNPSSEPKPFTFGSGSASNDAKPAEKSLFGGSAPIEPPPSTVSLFGRTASDTANLASTTLFGNTTGEAPKSLFGSSAPQSTPFMFGQPSKELEKPTAPAAFAFGVSSTTPDETKKDAPFSFSQSAPSPAPASTGFSFGASTPTDASRTFSFGSRPVTPPNVGQDEDSMGMDQSPTRDVTPKVNEVRPTLNTGASLGFTFGASAPPFGQPQSATSTTSVASPFSFGGTTSNPPAFGAKLEEPKPSFGFGQPSSNAPPAFGFGKPAAAEPEPPRPNTAGSFGFASPSSTNAPAPSFAFGAGGGSNFGGSQASSSAPSSPSLNHQPAPTFSFGGAPAQPSNPFGFGSSQPASPATPTTPLPQFGGFGANPPSSPFGGNASLPGTNGASAGGNAFTIGAAPSDTRPIRRMPRRGGKR